MRMDYLAGYGWLLLATAAQGAARAEPPALMLANSYSVGEVRVADYWVSEKYDGIRAYWTGTSLLTRTGNVIRPPAWFTARWPSTPLDGELWMGRGRFEALVSTVRDQSPDEAAWRQVRFMAFDLPTHPGGFTERASALSALLAVANVAWLSAVEQLRMPDEPALLARLAELTSDGAEGLMLHRADALYRAERSDDLLKLKRYEDAEARVIARLPGQGKHAGMMGALEVETREGVRFRLGTGFTDQERRAPPPVGAWVTYGYHGLTERGVPRFARFLRVHPLPLSEEDESPPNHGRR
jgi:DNA ligase-1